MSKVGLSIQRFSDFLMSSKLFAIVKRDRVHRQTRHQTNNHFFHRFFCPSFHQPYSQKTALPLHQCYNSSLMAPTNYGVRFPITNPLSLINYHWPLFNALPIGNYAACIACSWVFSVFFGRSVSRFYEL